MSHQIKSIPESLLREAMESLNYGLKYYEEYRESEDLGIIKQSIINLQKFIECTLQYFIAKINPLLVFTKSFKKTISFDDHIISFDEALNFYINNLEHGLLKIPSGYSGNKIKFHLAHLKALRNKITHWFIGPEEIKDIHKRLSETIQLTYFLYLEENINQVIHEKISSDSLQILDSIIDTESAKLDKAYREVESYKTSRISFNPKEQQDVEAPVFMCQSCRKNTLILVEPEETIFQCTFCKTTEDVGICSLSLVCSPIKTPKCYLNVWNEEYEDMICDDCKDFFDYKVSKE